MQTAMIKNVISDLGRVILFFDNHIFFRKMAEHCPYSAEEIANMVYCYPDLIRIFDSGKLSPREFFERVTGILSADIDEESFSSVYSDVFSLNQPVLEIIKRLRPDYRLILLSNTDAIRFGFIRHRFPEIFVFDEYVLSYEVGWVKPERRIYLEALKLAQAGADECLFMDDIPEYVEAARELGIRTILYHTGIDLEAELTRQGVLIS
jgi:putative hydrolase of the HAD superfamily